MFSVCWYYKDAVAHSKRWQFISLIVMTMKRILCLGASNSTVDCSITQFRELHHGLFILGARLRIVSNHNDISVGSEPSLDVGPREASESAAGSYSAVARYTATVPGDKRPSVLAGGLRRVYGGRAHAASQPAGCHCGRWRDHIAASPHAHAWGEGAHTTVCYAGNYIKF